MDTYGNHLAIANGTPGAADLLELPTCRLIDQLGTLPSCLAPRGVRGAGQAGSSGLALFGRHDREAVVTLGVNLESTSMRNQFSSDGKLLAWGNV